MGYDENLINKIDKITLFWYIIIFILIMLVFSKMNIGLNILVGMIIASGVLFVLRNDYVTTQNNAKELFTQKAKLIYPLPKESINHDKMINFLFSIQDFYVYNPQAYEDMMEHIDYIFKLYNEVNNNGKLAGSNYQLMQDQKKNALNALQSILLKIPVNAEYDNKLKNATTILEQLLNGYIQRVYVVHEKELYENGITSNTITIDKGLTGYNYQSKDIYYDSYELF